MTQTKISDHISTPPFETKELRAYLVQFLDSEFETEGITQKIGNFKWGVYAFFDYDGEPIYVGQTNEMVRTRIRRHLTNQRTDAVAMSVLDPFEVHDISVWPLPQFQQTDRSDATAKMHLNALERCVYNDLIEKSSFSAILNEQSPPEPKVEIAVPPHYRGSIVSKEVFKLRSHPDVRIARRSLIISRLAQVIAERQVQIGLRRVLLVQARRLQWLADRRLPSI